MYRKSDFFFLRRRLIARFLQDTIPLRVSAGSPWRSPVQLCPARPQPPSAVSASGCHLTILRSAPLHQSSGKVLGTTASVVRRKGSASVGEARTTMAMASLWSVPPPRHLTNCFGAVPEGQPFRCTWSSDCYTHRPPQTLRCMRIKPMPACARVPGAEPLWLHLSVLTSGHPCSSQTAPRPHVSRAPALLPELALGHLRYRLTGVPPQSNSPPGTVPGAGRARPARPGAWRQKREPLGARPPASPGQ